jgi:3-oxoacyl-(acyl-carrier-protein) synthase
VHVKATHPGAFYANRQQLQARSETVLREIDAPSSSVVVTSANGTFVDRAQAAAIRRIIPGASVYTAAPSLGEGVGAGGLWQIIIAAQMLMSKSIPPLLHRPDRAEPAGAVSQSMPLDAEVVALSCGMNQQIAAACLTITMSGENR